MTRVQKRSEKRKINNLHLLSLWNNSYGSPRSRKTAILIGQNWHMMGVQPPLALEMTPRR